MGTVEGPVTVVVVDTPTVYNVLNKGCLVATFKDPQHAQAYAEWISPPPKEPAPEVRHVVKLTPKCRGSEWIRYRHGILYWRYDPFYGLWEYSLDRMKWTASVYAQPTDEDGYLFHEMVKPKKPEEADELHDAHRGSVWRRTATQSLYRYNGTSWEIRFSNGTSWIRWPYPIPGAGADQTTTKPGFVEVLDGSAD